MISCPDCTFYCWMHITIAVRPCGWVYTGDIFTWKHILFTGGRALICMERGCGGGVFHLVHVGWYIHAPSLLHVLGGAMAPVSNPPHIPSPDSTAVLPPPPTGGVAVADSLPATEGQTSSSREITHAAG